MVCWATSEESITTTTALQQIHRITRDPNPGFKPELALGVKVLFSTSNLFQQRYNFPPRFGIDNCTYIDYAVDMHRFPYLFRAQCGAMMFERLPAAQVMMGLVVEARKDEEMPERMLMCVQINNVLDAMRGTLAI